MRQEGDAAQRPEVKNYIGKPIPEKLYSQLVATHQRLQKKVGGETLMLTAETCARVGRSHGRRRQRVPRQIDLVSYFST